MVGLLFTVIEGLGQLPEPVKLTTPAPQTPEAASLGKYGEVPVGHYTGVPKIEVPIYEINTSG